jgi:HEAT repeat protein
MTEALEVLERLRDADAAVRLKAAREVADLALRETSCNEEAFFQARGVMEAIIHALDDPEPEVAEQAVIALAEGARRYVKGAGGYEGVRRLLKSRHAQTRAWAARAAGVVGGHRCAEDLLPLVHDRSAKVRGEVYNVLVDLSAAGQLFAEHRKHAQEAAVTSLGDDSWEVRDLAASALRELGDGETLGPLKAARRKEKDQMAKESLDLAIEAVQRRA